MGTLVTTVFKGDKPIFAKREVKDEERALILLEYLSAGSPSFRIYHDTVSFARDLKNRSKLKSTNSAFVKYNLRAITPEALPYTQGLVVLMADGDSPVVFGEDEKADAVKRYHTIKDGNAQHSTNPSLYTTVTCVPIQIK
jgi:hypothetical protein